MVNAYSNKKKIRGWKRKIKALERWKYNNINLDLANLEKNNYDYVKIWIDPFYRLTKRNPPHWYRIKIVEAFSEIFNNWNNSLKTLGKDFYLKIWLYDPNFINSQIVCAINEKINYYENTFNTNKELRKFPIDKFSNNPFLKGLKFELAIDDYFVSSDDDFYTEKQMEKFKKKAYLVREYNYNDELKHLYFVKCGNVWIGSR